MPLKSGQNGLLRQDSPGVGARMKHTNCVGQSYLIIANFFTRQDTSFSACGVVELAY